MGGKGFVLRFDVLTSQLSLFRRNPFSVRGSPLTPYLYISVMSPTHSTITIRPLRTLTYNRLGPIPFNPSRRTSSSERNDSNPSTRPKRVSSLPSLKVRYLCRVSLRSPTFVTSPPNPDLTSPPSRSTTLQGVRHHTFYSRNPRKFPNIRLFLSPLVPVYKVVLCRPESHPLPHCSHLTPPPAG